MSNELVSESISLKDELRTLIAEAIGIREDQLTERTSLYDDLGLDSVAVLKIVSLIEHKYGIELDEDQLELMNTLESAYKYIDYLLNKTR